MLGKKRRKIANVLVACISGAAIFMVGMTSVLANEDGTGVGIAHQIVTNSVEGWPQGADIFSDTGCLIEADTGTVLYNKGMMEKMYPASTTKIMTALIAIENSSLDEIVEFTETGVAEAYSGSSNLYTQVGEKFTMEDCLYALLMKSANDFASQIAEHVGGTVENFAQMMNDRAAELGCTNTHFVNAHGLFDPDHYTCAYDMALIMAEACKNETFQKISLAVEYTIPASHLVGERYIATHNAMIVPGGYYEEGVLGGKTGFTDESMYTLVTAVERNGLRLVASTMHAPDSVKSFNDANALYKYGFDNFQNIVLENGQNVYSGGTATVPYNAVVTDIDMREGERFDTEFGNMVREYFLYNDYSVGEVAISQAYFDEKYATPTPTPSPEVTETEPQVDDKITREDIENIEPDLKSFNKGELLTAPHIAIAVLLVLVIWGIILIIVSAVRNSKAKKRKRKKCKKRG